MQKRNHKQQLATQSTTLHSYSIIAENLSGEPTIRPIEKSEESKLQPHENEAPKALALLELEVDKTQSKIKSEKLNEPDLTEPLEVVEDPEPREEEVKRQRITGAIALLLSIVGTALSVLSALSVLGSLGIIYVLPFALVPGAILLLLPASLIIGLIALILAIKSSKHSKLAVLATMISTLHLGTYFLVSIFLLAIASIILIGILT